MIERKSNQAAHGSFVGFRWDRPIGVVSAILLAAALAVPLSSSAAETPVALALFEFELDDFTAAATRSVAPADAAHLAEATAAVGRLLTESGRYRLVDVRAADAAAATTHTLYACDGCAAAIAAALGADQSFVGVVTRISRTEYVIRFRIRDSESGAVVAEGDSGLRMGADYSWHRGAARLVRTLLPDLPVREP